MSNKIKENFKETTKKVAGITKKKTIEYINPLKWPSNIVKGAVETPFRHISYRPGQTSSKITGINNFRKIFKRKTRKELLETYKNVEYQYDFNRAMQAEGVNKKTLNKRHSLFQWINRGVLFFIVFSLYKLFNVIFLRIEEGTVLITLLPSIAPFLSILFISLGLYLYYAWLTFRIRNRTLINQYQFLKIAMKDYDQLLPIHDIEDSILLNKKENKKK